MSNNSDAIYEDIKVLPQEKADYLVSKLRSFKDFPKEGILFRDIFGVLADNKAFEYLIDAFEMNAPKDVDVVVGTDSRGFLIAAPLALRLGVGFVPLRKLGKLPPPVTQESYQYEYAEAALELHEGDIKPGQKVLMVDDLLATGGTTSAGIKLIQKAGGDIQKIIYFIELIGLDGINLCADIPVSSLIKLPA